jgi:hypothetical protein
MGLYDKSHEVFDKIIAEIKREPTEDRYTIDFDEFLEHLKKEDDDLICYFAERILRLKVFDDEDSVYLDRIHKMLYSMRGEESEEALILHRCSSGLMIKGDVPEGVKVILENRFKEV